MDDQQLIKMIQGLKGIKPRENWVILAKKQILGEEMRPKPAFSPIDIFPRFNLKWVLAPVIAFSLLFGFTGLAQQSLPGDFLYPVKKAMENGRTALVAETERPKERLELAGKRLEELTKIAETNQVKKLAPALNELETTKQAVKTEVTNLVKGKPEKEAVKVAKEIAPKLKEINEKEDQVFASLGLEPRRDSEPIETVVELLIKDGEKATLNETQANYLKEAKDYFSAGDYNQALQKILLLSYPQP